MEKTRRRFNAALRFRTRLWDTVEYFYKWLMWWLHSKENHRTTALFVLRASLNLGCSRPGCPTWSPTYVSGGRERRKQPQRCGGYYNTQHYKVELADRECSCINSKNVRAGNSPSLLLHSGAHKNASETRLSPIPIPSIDSYEFNSTLHFWHLRTPGVVCFLYVCRVT